MFTVASDDNDAWPLEDDGEGIDGYEEEFCLLLGLNFKISSVISHRHRRLSCPTDAIR